MTREVKIFGANDEGQMNEHIQHFWVDWMLTIRTKNINFIDHIFCLSSLRPVDILYVYFNPGKVNFIPF